MHSHRSLYISKNRGVVSKRSLLILGLAAAWFGAVVFPTVGSEGSNDFQGLEVSLGKPPKTRAIPDLPSWVTVRGGVAVLGSREEGAGAPREVGVSSFWMGRTEVTAAQFARFLNDSGMPFESPQFRVSAGRKVPVEPLEPVAFVSFELAAAYASWLSGWLGVDVALPTEEEWEFAARGGLFAAPYPWGWDSPVGRAAFGGDRASAVGLFPPNGFGLFDMVGNVAEWCRPGLGADRAVVRGGSWSERSERFVRVWRRVEVPFEYRDADVGFRVIARPREAGRK